MTAVCTEVWRDHVCDNCGEQEDAPGHFSVSRNPYAYKPEGRFADHPSPAWAIICTKPRRLDAKGYLMPLTDAEEAAFCKKEAKP